MKKIGLAFVCFVLFLSITRAIADERAHQQTQSQPVETSSSEGDTTQQGSSFSQTSSKDIKPSQDSFGSDNFNQQPEFSSSTAPQNPTPIPSISQTQKTTPPVPEKPKPLQAQVGKSVIGKSFKEDNGISYQRLKVEKATSKYLFLNFELSEKDQWQNASMSVSYQGDQHPLLECSYDGFDSCFLSQNQVKDNVVFFITIHCQQDCSYSFKAHWSDLEHLKPGDDTIFIFGKEKSQLYHVELDDQGQFEEIRVFVRPRVHRHIFDKIRIYGKYGTDAAPTIQDHDFTSINLWQGGEGLFLAKKNLKSLTFTILIVGVSQTSYHLTCQKVVHAHHQLEDGEHLYEYASTGQTRQYHISLNQSQEEYSLRFSVFSGEVEVGYYLDAEYKQSFPLEPFEYMKDSEYVLYPAQLTTLSKNGLFIKVTASKRDATYTIRFQERGRNTPVQLHQHTYGFILMKQKKFAYFDFKRWISQSDSNIQFIVNAIQVTGKVKPQFRLCTKALSVCTDPVFYTKSTQILPAVAISSLSQKQIYELNIKSATLMHINDVEEQAIIIIQLIGEKNATKDSYNIIALEFIDQKKALYLRQNRPFEDRLNEGEKKTYKYLNSDPKVKQIRIHLNDIVGKSTLVGYINKQISFSSGNTLRFTKNLQQQIIIEVTSQDTSRSIYGMSMQIIHESVNDTANVVVIGEDITYTQKIAPNSFVIFQVSPIYYDFFFRYVATQSVIACKLGSKSGTCINPNGTMDLSPKLATRGMITGTDENERTYRIKITNPYQDSTAQVRVIFHSRSIERCENRKIGKVYNEIVSNGSCLSYILDPNNKNSIELYVSKRQYASLHYTILICGIKIEGKSQARFVKIDAANIKQLCADSLDNHQLSLVWAVKPHSTSKDSLKVTVDLVVQYSGKAIILPEGIAYQAKGRSSEGPLKTFAFSLLNAINTRIQIRQLKGRLQAFAKIIQHSQLEKDTVSRINYHYASEIEKDYSQQPIILIGSEYIKQKLPVCQDCMIHIGVFSLEEEGSEVEFEIEVIQRWQTLSEDGAVAGYLQKGSIAYYSFLARQDYNTSLLFLLSDHNMHCANLYLALDEHPGPKHNIAQSQGSNELIARHTSGEKQYFLAVEAAHRCDYSIGVISTEQSIHKLQKGRQNILHLSQGRIKYFTFQNNRIEPFKIIAISKFGQLKFHLNKSQLLLDHKTYTKKELDPVNFAITSEHANILTIQTNNTEFCHNCNYLLAVEAVKSTEATLFLAGPLTIIPLQENRFFSDYLYKMGDYTLASYNDLEKTEIQIVVHSGQIQILAAHKQTRISHKFKAQKDKQIMIIDILSEVLSAPHIPEADPNLGKPKPFKNTTYSPERIPINLIISTSTGKASYSIKMNRVEREGKQAADYQQVLTGEPNHVELSSKPLCLNGYFRQGQEEIILSTSSADKKQIYQIHAQARVSNHTASVNLSYYGNLALFNVSIPKDITFPSSYQLCLLLNKTVVNTSLTSQDSQDNQTEEVETKLKAIVTQSNEINILPSNVQLPVKNENIFVINTPNQFLLQVLECSGEAKISYANSLKTLNSSKLKALTSVGISQQTHAIKITQSDTTFVKVNSAQSIVSWIPIVEEEGQGLGYISYAAGDLRYTSRFKQLNVQFQPLLALRTIKAEVNATEYHLYLSDSEESIQQTAHCDAFSAKGTLIYNLGPHNASKKGNHSASYLNFPVEKADLESHFHDSQNIYLTIVAKLKLKPQGSKDLKSELEHYTFIYARQQVPVEAYRQGQIQAIPYHYLVPIVVSIAGLFLLLTYLFTRKIFPLLARLKNSNLVEEEAAGGDRKDDLEVPASSDRNQRAAAVVIETEDRMGK